MVCPRCHGKIGFSQVPLRARVLELPWAKGWSSFICPKCSAHLVLSVPAFWPLLGGLIIFLSVTPLLGSSTLFIVGPICLISGFALVVTTTSLVSEDNGKSPISSAK